ncbi:ArsR family transcriptional regulator [candidate division KSB1 bacterium]|nr:MAG: ArsR family transcriptional regulator [candidate division KSB1 bacterium]
MQGREFKDFVFQEIAVIAQAFASPKRLEIIDILAQGERSVETLAHEVSMTIANTSRHLQVLKSAGIVRSRKQGVSVIYLLADDGVLACWKALQTLAEKRRTEIKEMAKSFFAERDPIEPVSIAELQRRLKNNEIVLFDVRPIEEYENGHLPGAVSMPLIELKSGLDRLSKRREIVAYCRGRYCVLAAEAVAILKRAGYKALRLEDGVYEWQQAGLAIEMGNGRMPNKKEIKARR